MALQLQLDIVADPGSGLEPRLLKKVERASRNAQRLTELIAALLDVGRIASGTMSLSLAETDLAALVRDVVDRLAEAAAAAKCEVTMHLATDVIGIWDPLRLAQVASNLLANAFKYAAGTAIEVSTERHGDRMILRVRDHGPGIAEEDRERIFARFERASARSLGGLGLGLYVAHQIVTAHGGTIRVDAAPGGGALFTVELPLQAGTVPVEAA
jgi:signal transduction histidine kinase